MHILLSLGTLFLTLVLSASPSGATKACTPLTPEQFSTLKAGADLIVRVSITDYAAPVTDTPLMDASWTAAKVLQVYKGDAGAENIKISGWTSYSMPLYTLARGQEAVLLLKRSGGEWRLADARWLSCTPAVIAIPPEMDEEAKEAFIHAQLGMVGK